MEVNGKIRPDMKVISVARGGADVRETQAPPSGDKVSLGQGTLVSQETVAPSKEEKPPAPPAPAAFPQYVQIPQADGTMATLPVHFVDGQMVIDPSPDLLAKLLANAPAAEGAAYVNPLADIPPLEMSPIGDFLSIDPAQAADTLVERQPAIYDYALHHRKFSQALDGVLYHTETGPDGKAVKKPNKDALPKLRTLENFLVTGKPPEGWSYPAANPTPLDNYFHNPRPEKLYPDEVTAIIEGYKDVAAFEDVARFYEAMRSRSPELVHYDVPREYYVVALNKGKPPRIKDSIRESEAMIADRVKQVHAHPMSFLEASRRNVYRGLGINGEVLSGTGKAYKNIQDLAEKQIDGMVKEANFAKLFADMSGTKLENWKIGSQTVAQLALDKTATSIKDRVATIISRDFPAGSEESLKNANDLATFLATTSGVPQDQWKQQFPGPEALVDLFKGGDDPLGTATNLTGEPLCEWAGNQLNVALTASAPLNELAGKVARGKGKSEAVLDKARELTGSKLDGPVINATFKAKVGELLDRVTKGGTIDSDLVDLVTKASSSNVGRNLLDLSRKALEVSRDYYTAGFGVDFEYYPGINVVYNELSLGNEKTAQQMIPLVQYAVAREGGATSTDYWNLATQMELAALGNQPQTAHDLLPRLFRSAKVGWELGTTADNLEKRASQRQEEGGDASLLTFVTKKFRERMEVGFPAPADFDLEKFISNAQKEMEDSGQACKESAETLTPEQKEARAVADTILRKSKNFSDAFNSKFVGGSWAFVRSGGVADTTINRPTVSALRQVNTHLGLDKLDKPEDFSVFSERMHRYIDTKFALNDDQGGRPMEDLHSEVHKKRDKFTENRHEFCQSRLSGNGRTNLVTEVMLGQSDCRHTDATYQACFDLWKRDHQTRELQSCLDAIMDGHEETYQRAFERAQAWNDIQVVSMDMAFHAPVQAQTNDKGELQKYAIMVDGQGQPVRTEDGKFQLDPKTGKPFTLEDHTMPLLVKFNGDKTVKELKAVDPFYRSFWNVGNVDVDPKGVLDENLGLYMGNAGSVASDGKPVELYATPTRYSGAALAKVPGECGQVTMGGLEYKLDDLAPLLSDDNKLTHLVDAITGMVTGTAKERVLNAVMTRMLDESAADAHNLWKAAQDRKLTDPQNPFLGYSKDKVVVTEDLKGKGDDALRAWLREVGPENADLPDFKLQAIRNAEPGSVVYDPHYLSYGEMLEKADAVRLCGDVAVAPLALSLYLQDFRFAQDLKHVLDNMLEGKDPKGLADLEKVHRLAQLSAQLVAGERGYDHSVAELQATGDKTKLQARQDFKPWHAIANEDATLAELDAYTLKPAAEWMLKQLDKADTTDGARLLSNVVENLVEGAAADAHNVGWKTSKDKDFANNSNPFVGWAPKRQRISSNNTDVPNMDREGIAKFYNLPVDQVSEEKAEAIRTATKDAIAKAAKDGKDVTGGDVTHQLYKEYTEMLKDQSDGGTRRAGANAVPLLVLSLYLSDFRGADTATVDGLKHVLGGLLAATDKEGLKDVTMLNHVAFQAAQLPYGERSEEREVPTLKQTGQMVTRHGQGDLTTEAAAPAPALQENSNRIRSGAEWLQANLGGLVEKTKS